MKLALFGGTGQIGWELQRALAPLGRVIAPTRAELDVGDRDRLQAWLRKQSPQVVVNAAAYTAVDAAETDQETAYRVNALAPALLAEECERLGAWLLDYSTDYVFDGTKPLPYREDDAAHPLSVYGRSKLQGEQAIAKRCTRHLILRTSWVFSPRGNNFPLTILRLARERETIRVVDDQIGSPTAAELVADASVHALRTVLDHPSNGPQLSGIYHVAAGGTISWHGYARHLVERALALGFELRIPSADAILPISSRDYRAPAARPHNSCLDTSRFRQVFGLDLPEWQTRVDRMLLELAERAHP